MIARLFGPERAGVQSAALNPDIPTKELGEEDFRFCIRLTTGWTRTVVRSRVAHHLCSVNPEYRGDSTRVARIRHTVRETML